MEFLTTQIFQLFRQKCSQLSVKNLCNTVYRVFSVGVNVGVINGKKSSMESILEAI